MFTIHRGIFFKVFTYTAIFLLAIICVTVGVFSQQFLSFYNTTQQQQLYTSYQNLHERLIGKSNEEIIREVETFFAYNQSFTFYIRDDEGRVIFTTPNADTSGGLGEHRIRMSVGYGHTLFAVNRAGSQINYSGLIQRSLFALACMLAVGMVGAFIFARQMTDPIKRLADDTKRMANLQDVISQPERPGALFRKLEPSSPQFANDEIGSLARDVHFMYDKLKDTISKLEDEILRVREMEESQRYFFAAASHELKTPIAAASVLLEGMIENIGDYKDHPKYLREVVKLMDAQNKVISEIFELVNLYDRKIIPVPKEISVSEAVNSVLPNHQTLADANGQHIITNIPKEHFCIADHEMLKKILSNVILNAVQNTPQGGEITIWSEPVSDQYRISVFNKGVVIEKEVLSKLFDPFFREDKARSRKTGRSGLGLTIVKKTLDVMGADFALEQKENGVLFWMDLPAV